MNLSLIRIRFVFPYFNERPITNEEFWQAVKKEKIIVKQLPLLVDGYYTCRRGRHYILIDSKLSGIRWLHTALHELHHYLFDVPSDRDGGTFYRGGKIIDRREYKADAFALCGIMPWPELIQITPADLAGDPTLANIVRDRIAVRADFGI